jgi:hypothetical protein
MAARDWPRGSAVCGLDAFVSALFLVLLPVLEIKR